MACPLHKDLPRQALCFKQVTTADSVISAFSNSHKNIVIIIKYHLHSYSYYTKLKSLALVSGHSQACTGLAVIIAIPLSITNSFTPLDRFSIRARLPYTD